MIARLRANIQVQILVLLLILASNSKATAAQPPDNDPLKGFQKYDGFIPLWVNEDKNSVCLELSLLGSLT